MRDRIFASLLAAAGLLIVIGVATWSAGAALVAAGVLVVAWSWLVFVFAADDVKPTTSVEAPRPPMPGGAQIAPMVIVGDDE